jgi:hypothetical protein
MTLEAIKEAIAELPDAEKASLISWLHQQDAQAWDQQIEADFSQGGAGIALLQMWDTEIQSGQSTPLEEFFQQQETKLSH